MLMWRRPVALINARVAGTNGAATTLRFDRQILGIGTPPRRGDTVMDVEGAHVLPGLINAHDHLELNHYGRLKCRDRYENASQWIEDLRPALRADPAIRRQSGYPLAARLFIGALKNLLAGVTTVAHHNPRYREIGAGFPIRVLERYGWAHSFLLENRPADAHGKTGGNVRERWLATPARAPFIVHLAEGVDREAAAELDRLDSLGCLRPNTVMVHGVALTPDHWQRVRQNGAGVVWCPASNMFLFSRTAPVRQWLDASSTAAAHVCLGSDSRVTGARDLLDELRVAASVAPLTPNELLRMVTDVPVDLLRLPHGGRLAPGEPADLMVIPPFAADAASALLAASRRDVLLVAVGGRPLIGAGSLEAVFEARGTTPRPVVVDGAPRLAASRLARAIARCPVAEPGVKCLS